MKTLMTLSAAAFLATGTAAFAGGLSEPVVAPAPAPVAAPVVMAPVSNDWTGFYLGAQVGTGSVDVGGASSDLTNYGVHAGYLYDLGSFVIGGELDVDMLDIDGASNGDDYVARAKAIAGYDAGRFMPYLTAGFAQLYLDDGAGGTNNDSGTFYGVGATYAVTNNVRVGVEYLDHQFDDFNGGGVDIGAQTTSLKVSYAF